MITPEEFPYIKSLYVNDCYAYKNFNVELHDYKPFSHLILTGKNGSGKSTILRAIHAQFFPIKSQAKLGIKATNTTRTDEVVSVRESVHSGIGQTMHKIVISFLKRHEKIQDSGKTTLMKPDEVLGLYRNKVYSYFEAKRGYQLQGVEGPSKEENFTRVINSLDFTSGFINSFKQYLVNKKIDQLYAQVEGRTDDAVVIDNFFELILLQLSNISEEAIKKIEFDHRQYELYLHLSDGRRVTFETLSEGFSAVLSILMDLFMRVDLVRKQVGDYSYNPCGIVLIDEPETHLHLQLQEQVLPLLTSLFPNIQFIAATHSPAVIASIKNATIFDLTTKETRISEEAVGRSYSELMRAHFGMNNEYSGIADELFRKVDKIIKENKNRPEILKVQLQQFFIENEAYLSPSFRVELESMILENV